MCIRDRHTIDEAIGADVHGVAAEAKADTGACTLRPGVNSWFEARTVRFSLSSPIAPEDVYDLCLESGRVELRRRTEVPGSPRFDGRDYRYTGSRPSLASFARFEASLSGGRDVDVFVRANAVKDSGSVHVFGGALTFSTRVQHKVCFLPSFGSPF